MTVRSSELEEYGRRLAADAPPLTEKQVRAAARLLVPTDDEAAAAA